MKYSRTSIFIVGALLVLSSCGGDIVPIPSPQPPVYASPHSPYWKMENGTFAEYKIYRGRGTYDPMTGCIEVDESSLVAGETDRTTNLVSGDGVARVTTAGGITTTEVPEKLAHSLLERSTGAFIGEGANYLQKDQSPPEPLLTVNPSVGETLNIDSLITSWDGTQFHFQTRYRTQWIEDGVVTTCLVEQPQLPNPNVYTQQFDGELLAQWYGTVSASGVIDNLILARRVN